MLVKIRANGQATIPKAIRQRLGLHAGDHLHVRLEGDVLIARRVEVPAARSPIADPLPTAANAGGPRLLRAPDPLGTLLVSLRALRARLGPLYAWLEGGADEEGAAGTALPGTAVRDVARIGEVAAGVPPRLRGMATRIHWPGLDAVPTRLDADAARRWIEDELSYTSITVEGFFLARREEAVGA